MGKKKGGAKNKLARMSEEERARYLQHRADIEEEARRRKQQLVALYMKNKLKREEAFSRLNLAKINQEWRSILRQIKCQELKKELIEVARLFQDALEQKNRIIRRLLSDLDEAEEMYSNLSQSHMESVDKLIDIQNQRMEYFKTFYVTQKEIILKECKEDFEMYKKSRRKLQTDLECVYFATEDLHQQQFHEANENHLNRMDDLNSSMTIKLEEITEIREQQLELLWTEYQEILNNYVQYTEEFYSEYTELKENDELNTKLIRGHCIEVARVTDQMTDLKLHADNLTEESQFQIKYLEKHRCSLYERYIEMKKDFDKQLNVHQNEFQLMVVNAHQILKSLENWNKNGETLLQLTSICHRFESEREQVLPFGLRSSVDKKDRELMQLELQQEEQKQEQQEDQQVAPEDQQQLTNVLKKTAVQTWSSMEMFWTRVNNVRLDVACLKKEKTFLENENQQLKLQLKEYMTNVILASDGPNGNIQDRIALNRPTSMKIEKVLHIDLQLQPQPQSQQTKLPRTSDGNFNNKNRKPSSSNTNVVKRRRRPYTCCIEGNLSNAVRSMHLIEGKLNTIPLKTIVNW